MPFTVGLTGGIASGKSAVAMAFERLGIPVLDADVVAREIVAPPSPTLGAITREFGREYLQPDGALDRRRLREHVFANAAARRKLEQITHPAIRQRLMQWRDAQTAPYCILTVAILLESGMDSLVDRILVVDASEEAQLQRLQSRDGTNEVLARQMLASQTSRAQRLARADDVIENGASMDHLRQSARHLHERYLRCSQGSERR
ncbi:MAG: dephospho-CoA kinase [Pseudomonadota bacterium]